MKLVLISLALVALALSQNTCDSDDLITSWATYQEGPAFTDSLWEEKQLVGWGMDGNNKWNDFWLRPNGGGSSYSRVTCGLTSQGAIPNYDQFCGDCTLTTNTFTECLCYPYYDVADSYQESPKPNNGEGTQNTPNGWPGAYAIGNPPFESSTDNVNGQQVWSVQNCQQYQPAYIYYYTKTMRMNRDGSYQQSIGISTAFEPSIESWADFCQDEFQNVNQCHVPSDDGGIVRGDLFGARFRYDEGLWRANDEGDVQFFHRFFENGCHAKTRNYKFPTANYCGDDSGWRFGAGTTAHVHFGCDVSTFFDTETDYDREIDDEDCGSVYLLFDEMNYLDVTVDHYNTYEWVEFNALASPINSVDCWYRSKFIDHRTNTPKTYRTDCSASGLAVPLLALFSTIMMLLLNFF
jgi:hypothetical protein